MTNLRDSQSEYESVKDTFVSLDESVDKLKKLKKNRIEFADDETESNIEKLKKISLEYDKLIKENKALLKTDYNKLGNICFERLTKEINSIMQAISDKVILREEILENIWRWKLSLNTIEKYYQSSIVQKNIIEWQTQ